jgi:LemA protein
MWTTIAVIAIILLYFIAVYNGLIARRNQVREAWATVDTQLKRRYDLIPNLIETVRGAAKHEKETLTELTQARTMAMQETGIDSANAQNKISQTLKSLFAVAENYPELKANQNFLELQQELADTENKIQATRQFYNTVVMGLNTFYSIFDRTIEKNGLKMTSEKLNKGIIAFSPLAQGLLTNRYLDGIPEDSRIKTDGRFLKESVMTIEKIEKARISNTCLELATLPKKITIGNGQRRKSRLQKWTE